MDSEEKRRLQEEFSIEFVALMKKYDIELHCGVIITKESVSFNAYGNSDKWLLIARAYLERMQIALQPFLPGAANSERHIIQIKNEKGGEK